MEAIKAEIKKNLDACRRLQKRYAETAMQHEYFQGRIDALHDLLVSIRLAAETRRQA